MYLSFPLKFTLVTLLFPIILFSAPVPTTTVLSALYSYSKITVLQSVTQAKQPQAHKI